jgi:hypothetical protein
MGIVTGWQQDLAKKTRLLGWIVPFLGTVWSFPAAAQVAVHIEGDQGQEVRQALTRQLPGGLEVVKPAAFQKSLGNLQIGSLLMEANGRDRLVERLRSAGRANGARWVIAGRVWGFGTSLWLIALDVSSGAIAIERDFAVQADAKPPHLDQAIAALQPHIGRWAADTHPAARAPDNTPPPKATQENPPDQEIVAEKPLAPSQPIEPAKPPPVVEQPSEAAKRSAILERPERPARGKRKTAGERHNETAADQKAPGDERSTLASLSGVSHPEDVEKEEVKEAPVSSFLAPPPPREVWLELTPMFGLASRRLTYNIQPDPTIAHASSANKVLLLGAHIEAFPFVLFGANHTSDRGRVVRALGLSLQGERSVLLKTRVGGNTYTTTMQGWQLGVVGRIQIAAGQIKPNVSFGGLSFGYSGAPHFMPAVNYTYWRLGTDARYDFAWLSPFAGIAWRINTDLGRVGDDTFASAPASTNSWDLNVGAALRLTKHAEFSARLEWIQVQYKFAHDAFADPFTPDSAADRYINIWFGLSVLFAEEPAQKNQ